MGNVQQSKIKSSQNYGNDHGHSKIYKWPSVGWASWYCCTWYHNIVQGFGKLFRDYHLEQSLLKKNKSRLLCITSSTQVTISYFITQVTTASIYYCPLKTSDHDSNFTILWLRAVTKTIITLLILQISRIFGCKEFLNACVRFHLSGQAWWTLHILIDFTPTSNRIFQAIF